MFVFMHPVYHGRFRISAKPLVGARCVASKPILRARFLAPAKGLERRSVIPAALAEATPQRNESSGAKHGAKMFDVRKNNWRARHKDVPHGKTVHTVSRQRG